MSRVRDPEPPGRPSDILVGQSDDPNPVLHCAQNVSDSQPELCNFVSHRAMLSLRSYRIIWNTGTFRAPMFGSGHDYMAE